MRHKQTTQCVFLFFKHWIWGRSRSIYCAFLFCRPVSMRLFLFCRPASRHWTWADCTAAWTRARVRTWLTSSPNCWTSLDCRRHLGLHIHNNTLHTGSRLEKDKQIQVGFSYCLIFEHYYWHNYHCCYFNLYIYFSMQFPLYFITNIWYILICSFMFSSLLFFRNTWIM